MANMSDRTNVVAPVMNFFLNGGAALTAPTTPLHLRLMTAVGSNTANGTELTGTGYTAGGATMGTTAFGANTTGVSSNSNSISWTNSGGTSWTAVVGIEIWDTAATPKRLLQGSITSVTLGAGNTLTFAAASITADASQW